MNIPLAIQMPLTTLRTFDQAAFLLGGGPSARGVCYYLCNYIEGDDGPWRQPDTYETAVENARNFTRGTAMINFAKAQNLRKLPQLSGYAQVTVALAENRLYRIEYSHGAPPPADPNHEAIAVTGPGGRIVYFEPNFGFFEATLPNANNREAFEHYVRAQYQATGGDAANFAYKNVRSITASSPKGFA
jgi:hypothetical protein